MDREGSNRIGSYLRQVDKLSLARFGLSFTAMQADVEDAAGIQVAREMRSGMAPDSFVDLLFRTFPFRSPGSGGEAVATANLGMLALATFARSADGWGVGPDGGAYRQDAGGVDRISYGTDRTGTAVGFACARAEGATLGHGPDGKLVPPAADAFVPVAGALDIGDAVDLYERTLAAAHGGPSPR